MEIFLCFFYMAVNNRYVKRNVYEQTMRFNTCYYGGSKSAFNLYEFTSLYFIIYSSAFQPVGRYALVRMKKIVVRMTNVVRISADDNSN